MNAHIFQDSYFLSILCDVRAFPTVFNMWSCIVKLDEENPMYVYFTKENGFGSA
jgi:hypothetical protein